MAYEVQKQTCLVIILGVCTATGSHFLTGFSTQCSYIKPLIQRCILSHSSVGTVVSASAYLLISWVIPCVWRSFLTQGDGDILALGDGHHLLDSGALLPGDQLTPLIGCLPLLELTSLPGQLPTLLNWLPDWHLLTNIRRKALLRKITKWDK